MRFEKSQHCILAFDSAGTYIGTISYDEFCPDDDGGRLSLSVQDLAEIVEQMKKHDLSD